MNIVVQTQHVAWVLRTAFAQAVQQGKATLYSDANRLYNTYYKHLLDNPEYIKMPSEEQDVLAALFMIVNNYDTNSIRSLMNAILPVLDLEFG